MLKLKLIIFMLNIFLKTYFNISIFVEIVLLYILFYGLRKGYKDGGILLAKGELKSKNQTTPHYTWWALLFAILITAINLILLWFHLV